MVKKPFALCFFDDGNLSTYADQELMSKKDIFSHLEDSAMNKDIALHVLDVSVTRDNNGNITGAISIDNEASRYTTMLFNKVFANYTPKTPPTDNTDKTIFMAEGIGVVIYMGYYTGIRKWDQIVKKLEGVIDSISFSFQQSGTPQMVLAVSDSYTFMGNPRMQNTELTMQPEGTSDPDNYTPLRSAYPYTSNAKRIEVEIATDRLQEITSGGEASTDMSGGGTIGGGQTYAGDTAPAKVVSSAAQSSNPRKKTTKFAKSKYLPKFNIFAEEYGVRDSQAVLLIAKRYNDMIDALYPIFEVYPMYLSEADAQLNQKMRDRLKIKNTFVCMTGEGGNRYSIMSAFHPRVRDNKVAHPVNMGFSDLLLSLASKHHFDVFVRNRCLFFIPPLIKRTPDFTYYYGATEDDIPSDRKLLSFEPSLTSVQLGVDFHSFEFNPDNGMVDFIRTKFGKDLDKCTVFLVCIDSQDGSGLKYFEVKGDTVGRTVEKDAFAKLTPLTGSQYISKSYFSSGTEELVKSITETEADAIESSMEMEGNPFIDIGMTMGVKGLDRNKKPSHKRFDANYRITAVTDSYSGVYKTTVKAMTRSLQGISAASDAGAPNMPFIGLWASTLLLEPSIVWAGQHTDKGRKLVDSMESYLSKLSASGSSNVSDPLLELDSLKNNLNPLNEKDDTVTGRHTVEEDLDKSISEGDLGQFSTIADQISCLTYEEAWEILGYQKIYESTWQTLLPSNTQREQNELA